VAFALIYGAFGLSASYAAPLSIVVIGDSNIEGKGVSRSDAYPAQLERALRARGLDVRVANEARTRVAEIAARLKARGIRVLVLPTGKAFQGPIADDPKFHVEARGGTTTGPAPGTTNWHLTPDGYAQVVDRTLPQVIAALNGSP
jgi:acyl-CoA thioesterase-1